MNSKMTLFVVLLAILQSSCESKKVDVEIEITAVTNQNEPVSGAEVRSVSSDGVSISLGKTDIHGKYRSRSQFIPKSAQRIEISKASDIYYFAPYYKSIEISAEQGQKFQIAATMFYVPKPQKHGADDRVLAVNSASTEVSASEIDPAKVDETSEPPHQEVPKKELMTDNSEVVSPENLQVPPAISDDTNGTLEKNGTKENLQNPAASLVDLKPLLNDAGLQEQTNFPVKARENRGSFVFTVHVVDGANLVAGAEVMVGEQDTSDLKTACTTNGRGRCAIRFPETPEGPVTFVTRKAGFQTNTTVSLVSRKGLLKIPLTRGHTIDIFAMVKTFNFERGIEGVDISIAGRHVGRTDAFGHFSYLFSGAQEDLLGIALNSRGFLPEVYETDFIAAGPMTLVRYFSPASPSSVRVSVAPMQIAARSTNSLPIGDLETNLLPKAIDKAFWSTLAFIQVPWDKVLKAAAQSGDPYSKFIGSGWSQTDLKAHLDVMIVPTVVEQVPPLLELALIDSNGVVLAAAKEKLDSFRNASQIDQTVKQLAEKLTKFFPFEGAVLKATGKVATINIGESSGRSLAIGETINVYGAQKDKLGRAEKYAKIAVGTVKSVNNDTSEIEFSDEAPRSLVTRGDMFVLNRRARQIASAGQNNLVVRVLGNPKGLTQAAIPQANVYYQNEWLGGTDVNGRIAVSLPAEKTGILKIIKHGYATSSRTLDLSRVREYAITLKREAAFVRVDSIPQGGEVYVDGKPVGRTPIAMPVAVPVGFVKLEIKGLRGFKDYQKVIELETGTVDLSGESAVVLEADLLSKVGELVASGQFSEALDLVLKVSPDHSDYLEAQHIAGSIYLNNLADPAKAAASFGKVTENIAVKEFQDKRFIGAHVNEGIALFKTAEALAGSNSDIALAHYQKAVEVLSRVEPQLRFIPGDQFPLAVHNVDFYRALSNHKIWQKTHEKSDLETTLKLWESYVNDVAKNIPLADRALVENAGIYLKQARASLDSDQNEK